MARHDAERRKLATEPEREGNRVAHAKLTGLIWLPQRRSSVTRESQRRVARRSRTLSGDWLDHRRKQRPLHRNARRRDASLRSARARTSILNRSWIFERCSRQPASRSRTFTSKRRLGGPVAFSRFDFFAQSCDRVTNRIAHRYASLNSLPADITGSPMPIRTAPG